MASQPVNSFAAELRVHIQRKCPRCGNGHLDRVRRTWFDRFLGRQAVYRCEHCGKRFAKARLVSTNMGL